MLVLPIESGIVLPSQAATAGIEAASSATAAAVGGAADVAAEAAEAANRLSLATVQSGAEVRFCETLYIFATLQQ